MSSEIEILIEKYLEGKLDESQIKYLADRVSNEEVKEVFNESIEINYLLLSKYHNLDSNRAYQDFISHINSGSQKKPRGMLNYWMKYAAVFIGVVAIAFFVKNQLLNEPTESALLQIPDEGITLQFDNGEIELINKKKDTRIIMNSEDIKVKQVGERIVYEDTEATDKLIFNTITIPRGKTFQVQLSDGTIVYLNSETKFRYPVKFIEPEDREVFVTGEAYFKVAENKSQPFVVNAGDIKVQVTGTEFNVSNYAEYDEISTVLVTGSVNIVDSSSNQSQGIIPGDKASWSKTAKNFDVDKVNVADYTDWIYGKLTFRGSRFKEIKIKLEKHYNVSIINNNASLDNTTFNASFDIESIDEVLETFRLNFGIEYEIIDNQIVIN